MKILPLSALLLTLPFTANAAIISAADTSNGLTTFIDTTEQLQWLKVSELINTSRADQDTAVAAAGYRWATPTEITNLFTGLDTVAESAQTAANELMGYTDGSVIGGDVFWMARYDDPSVTHSQTQYKVGLGYLFIHNTFSVTNAANSKLGAFAVQSITVPAPAPIWLLGSSLLGLVGFKARKQATT